MAASPRRRCASQCKTGPRDVRVVRSRVTIKPRPRRREGRRPSAGEAADGLILATPRFGRLVNHGRIEMAETTIERLNSVWARTDRIFGLLAPEGYLAQPIALRHPFIFYVGHLPA